MTLKDIAHLEQEPRAIGFLHICDETGGRDSILQGSKNQLAADEQMISPQAGEIR
ncbi:MAG TPA: hypothetical protein VKB84_09845 [Candidatus Binataceae bacterium]|nr:hypothetical protein [Candidatus Binataceae bacterium]